VDDSGRKAEALPKLQGPRLEQEEEIRSPEQQVKNSTAGVASADCEVTRFNVERWLSRP
jgi:hypothetical protein